VEQDLLLLKVAVQEVKVEADDLTNLDVTIARYLVAALKAFKAQEAGYPGNYANQEQWNAKLDSITIPLEYYSQRWDYSFAEESAIVEAGQEAMMALAEIFPSLWI
jgi:hypothetical protein